MLHLSMKILLWLSFSTCNLSIFNDIKLFSVVQQCRHIYAPPMYHCITYIFNTVCVVFVTCGKMMSKTYTPALPIRVAFYFRYFHYTRVFPLSTLIYFHCSRRNKGRVAADVSLIWNGAPRTNKLGVRVRQPVSGGFTYRATCLLSWFGDILRKMHPQGR